MIGPLSKHHINQTSLELIIMLAPCILALLMKLQYVLIVLVKHLHHLLLQCLQPCLLVQDLTHHLLLTQFFRSL